jgi:hypothetical protein
MAQLPALPWVERESPVSSIDRTVTRAVAAGHE